MCDVVKRLVDQQQKKFVVIKSDEIFALATWSEKKFEAHTLNTNSNTEMISRFFELWIQRGQKWKKGNEHQWRLNNPLWLDDGTNLNCQQNIYNSFTREKPPIKTMKMFKWTRDRHTDTQRNTFNNKVCFLSTTYKSRTVYFPLKSLFNDVYADEMEECATHDK